MWLCRLDGPGSKEPTLPGLGMNSKSKYPRTPCSSSRKPQGAFFWEDRWLNGQRVQEVAPLIYNMIVARIRTTRMFGQAMEDGSWSQDVVPNIGPDALQEFLLLWPKVIAWERTENMHDEISWSWEANGEFTVRSAYAAKFWAREVVPTANLTWKSRAPSQCKFFTWHALQDRR